MYSQELLLMKRIENLEKKNNEKKRIISMLLDDNFKLEKIIELAKINERYFDAECILKAIREVLKSD